MPTAVPEFFRLFRVFVVPFGKPGRAYNNLAGTIYQMGLVDSSITLWQKAVRLDPSNQQFQNNLNFVKNKK